MVTPPRPTVHRSGSAGFTLVELLIGLALSLLVVMGVFAAFLLNQNGWMITTLTIQSSSAASGALERIVYGGGGPSLRSQEAGHVSLLDNLDAEGSWRLEYDGGARWLAYDAAAEELQDETGAVLCDRVHACTATLRESGVELDLTTSQSGRQFLCTSRMSSFIRFRN